MPFNFMYNPIGLFGRMGMGYQQPQQNPFAQRQTSQMGMPQMGISQMGMPQMGMGMPSYMPPYLAQYMQQYGMQGMGQRMPQQMTPQYGMQQYGMPQYSMPQQGNPNNPYQKQLPLGQNPQQANIVQSRRATAVQPRMNQPMGMGSISTGAMPPPSADLQAAMAQLNAAKAAGTIPQGDTFQNNPNRPQVTLQNALNSLMGLSPRG